MSETTITRDVLGPLLSENSSLKSYIERIKHLIPDVKAAELESLPEPESFSVEQEQKAMEALVAENERLKRQNGVLSESLSHFEKRSHVLQENVHILESGLAEAVQEAIERTTRRYERQLSDSVACKDAITREAIEDKKQLQKQILRLKDELTRTSKDQLDSSSELHKTTRRLERKIRTLNHRLEAVEGEKEDAVRALVDLKKQYTDKAAELKRRVSAQLERVSARSSISRGSILRTPTTPSHFHSVSKGFLSLSSLPPTAMVDQSSGRTTDPLPDPAEAVARARSGSFFEATSAAVSSRASSTESVAEMIGKPITEKEVIVSDNDDPVFTDQAELDAIFSDFHESLMTKPTQSHQRDLIDAGTEAEYASSSDESCSFLDRGSAFQSRMHSSAVASVDESKRLAFLSTHSPNVSRQPVSPVSETLSKPLTSLKPMHSESRELLIDISHPPDICSPEDTAELHLDTLSAKVSPQLSLSPIDFSRLDTPPSGFGRRSTQSHGFASETEELGIVPLSEQQVSQSNLVQLKRIGALNQKLRETKHQNRRLRSEIKKLESQLQKCKSDTDVLRREVQGLQKQIITSPTKPVVLDSPTEESDFSFRLRQERMRFARLRRLVNNIMRECTCGAVSAYHRYFEDRAGFSQQKMKQRFDSRSQFQSPYRRVLSSQNSKLSGTDRFELEDLLDDDELLSATCDLIRHSTVELELDVEPPTPRESREPKAFTPREVRFRAQFA